MSEVLTPNLLCMRAKLLYLCLILCDPMDCSVPGSSFHGILQAQYWSGLPCSPPGSLPDPETESLSLMSLALAGGFFTTEPPGKPPTGPGTVHKQILSGVPTT